MDLMDIIGSFFSLGFKAVELFFLMVIFACAIVMIGFFLLLLIGGPVLKNFIKNFLKNI